MKVSLLILHLIVLAACNSERHSGNTANSSSDIRRYNYIINSDDSLTRLDDTIFIASKYINGDLLYRGYYINGALNGPIDIYRKGNKFAYGLMENNKPTGLFRFISPQGNIDSIQIISRTGDIEVVDKELFRFQPTVIHCISTNFVLERPIAWIEVVDTVSGNTIGILDSSGSSALKPIITIFEQPLPANGGLKEAVNFAIDDLQESFESISLRRERYVINGLGTYYQLDFDVFLKGERYYYMSSVFLLEKSFIIVSSMAEYKSEMDYFLYSALFKEIVFRLRHQ